MYSPLFRFRPRLLPLGTALVAACVTIASASAQQQLRDGPGGEPPLHIPKITGPIVLDGFPDEAAWAEAVTLEGVMHLPDFGAPPSQKSEFLIAHDGEYLYFACRSYETDPSQIRVTTLARDVSAYNTDSCGIRLDTFNDEENALLFVTTPASVRTDWSFANDAQGAPNQDWNAFWDARGTLTDYGWAAEIRIPFSSLGFQVVDDQVVMGFAVGRSIVRNSENIVHPAIPPRWGPSSVAKPSQMRKMIMTDVVAQKPVYVTPYALTGGGHAHRLNDPRDAYLRDNNRVAEFGGDIRYGLTRNLNLDLTFNTDFAQVEADNQQVNLTRFSLFFPEQRRFFQERAAIFEFPLGGTDRLFHSRRIGLVDGEQVRIYGGGRLVGRIGEWDVGLLNMQTAGADRSLEELGSAPSENMGVLRARRRVLNPFSYVGGIFTSRMGTDGSYGLLYGTDAVVRLFGQNYITLNWAQSFADTEPGIDPTTPVDDEGIFDRALFRVNLQRRGTDGLIYTADLTRAGATFNPELGYLRRSDYLNGSGSIGYGWRPASAGSTFNRYSLSLNGNFYERNQDRSIESAQYSARASFETRGGHSMSADIERSYEDLLRPFPLSAEAIVPMGSYWFTEASLSYSPPSGALFRPNASIAGGKFYDGTRMYASISPNWSVSRHLSLGATYQVNHIDFKSRDQTFISHLARLRTEVTFTTRTSASAFVQYNSTGDLIASNFRFRYNPREGNDLYIVWNEAVNSDRFALDPIRPLSQERTILLKYSHTLTLGL